MKILYTLFILVFTSTICFSQQVVFEEEHGSFPFPLRIDNSGIYSIASFDVDKDEFYFSSFNTRTLYKYSNKYFSEVSAELNAQKDFIADVNLKEFLLPKKTDEDNSKDLVTLKKNYYLRNSLLKDYGGKIMGSFGEMINVLVPNKSGLIVESRLDGIPNRINLAFPSNLACADLIGIDKDGNLFLVVEKYLNELPLKIEREVFVVSKTGVILSQIILPNIKYIYTIKDLQIDSDGSLYHLIATKEKVQIVKWTSLTKERGERLYYPGNYNYELHYNNYTPTFEIKTINNELNKNHLLKASRTKALQIAETYIYHQYECKVNNLATNQLTAPDGDAVKTPEWLVVGMNARIPYKWGGFNTLAQFNAGLQNGKFAGDIVTTGVSSYALGVDCSGYVSRCWQLNYHSSTSDMPNITTQYGSWDNLKPGDAIHRIGHVRLFIKRNPNGSFKVAESAGRNWDVSFWSFNASDLVTYTPRYYNDMESNFNDQQPELISIDKTQNDIARLKWNCNASNILGYRVYHSTDGLNWNLVLNENQCQTTSADITISGTINFFRIASVKNDSPNFSESNWSNVLGLNAVSSQKRVLIVDGFERDIGSWQGAGHNFVAKYGKAFGLLNLDFTSLKNSELLNGNFKLENYQYVFWILGDESTINETFNSQEQQLIKKYLEEGGNLFLSGSEVGWDLDFKGTAEDKYFYNNYLKASFKNDDAGVLLAQGLAAGSMNQIVLNCGQTYYEDYPDEIAPVNGSRICMQYSNGKGAGIEYSGYFGNSTKLGKIIYFAFPLESTANDNAFNLVISKAIEFFNSVNTSVNTGENIPNEFRLEQNYPNPFNPTTTIRYSVPANVNGGPVNVTLKVFDVLGREVKTLVDEFKQPGSYNSQFSSAFSGLNSQLSSGQYFYQLRFGNYIETKKMILLK